jgi:hypothetical protein
VFDRATAPLKAQPRRSLLLAALIAVVAISAMLVGQLEEPLAATDGAASGASAASSAFQGGATVASAAAAQRSDEAAAATAAAKVGHFAVLPPRRGASFDATTGTSTVRLWMSDDVVRAVALLFVFVSAPSRVLTHRANGACSPVSLTLSLSFRRTPLVHAPRAERRGRLDWDRAAPRGDGGVGPLRFVQNVPDDVDAAERNAVEQGSQIAPDQVHRHRAGAQNREYEGTS